MKHGFKVWNVKGNVWDERPLKYHVDEQGCPHKEVCYDNSFRLVPETETRVYFYTGYQHRGRMLCEGDVYSVAGNGEGVVSICPLYGVVFEFRGAFGGYLDYDLPLAEVLAEDDLGAYLGHIAEGYGYEKQSK